jgi:PAS domain-containing protein
MTEQEKALRSLAEKLLRKQPGLKNAVAKQDLDYLLHELSVHQAELEVQNEELRRAQQALAYSQRKYSYLYHFSSIGYFTLDERGLIQEANVTGCSSAGIQRLFLNQHLFPVFVAKEDRKRFRDYLQAVVASEKKQSCRLKLLKNRNTPFLTELTTRKFVDDGGNASYLMIVTEISEQEPPVEKGGASSGHTPDRVAS